MEVKLRLPASLTGNYPRIAPHVSLLRQVRDLGLVGKGQINTMAEESFTLLEKLIAQGKELGCSGRS